MFFLAKSTRGLVVFCAYFVFCVNIGIYAKTLCSNFIRFRDDGDLRKGNFYIIYPESTQQTYIQIIVYVSDICQERSCSVYADTSVENAKELYRRGQPVRYAVYISKEATGATVKGIALRSSTECRVICEHETETIKPGVKSLQISLQPFGRLSVKQATCDPIQSFSHAGAGETCGVIPPAPPKVQFLILHGTEIDRGSWPWLVAINLRTDGVSSLICGGTLINHRAILTASHCLFNQFHEPLRPENIEIFVGRHDLSIANEEGSVRYGVSHIEVHPDYRPRVISFDADIGLIFTDSDVRYTQIIQPACIWESDEPIEALVNRTGVVAGWGVDESFYTTVRPNKVASKIVSYDHCIESNTVFEGITTKRNFCAGRRDGSGPCKGDSGGGFMMEVSGRWMVRGIVSGSVQHQQKICDLYQYVVYTDVFKFKHWLSEKISSYVPVEATTTAVTSTTHERNIDDLIAEVFGPPTTPLPPVTSTAENRTIHEIIADIFGKPDTR